MKKSILFIAGLSIFSCGKVPITGRKQIKLLPESMMIIMEKTEYTSFLTTNRPTSGTADAEMVNRVSVKIIDVVTQYFQKKNEMKKLEG